MTRTSAARPAVWAIASTRTSRSKEVDTPLGDVDDDGLAHGGGVSWQATPGIGIRADCTRMEGDLDSDAISPGAAFNF